MASKRVAKSAIDWSSFAKRIPEAQKPQFLAFKSKSDGYSMKVASLPEAIPTLDWTMYQSRVNVTGMVADFKKQYEGLTIPYPKDSYSSKIAEQEKTAMAHVTEFVKEAEASIQSLKAELVTVEAMMPIEEMNMEEYFDAFPQKALDPFDNPTMWPHTPEVQPEYIDQMEREGKFDEEH